MTMIAVYQYTGTPPFVLGDGLLTSEVALDRDLVLPTREHDNSQPISLNSFVSGLQQKVGIVNPHLAVAWSGELYECQKFLDDMYDRLSGQTTITDSIMNDYFRYVKKTRIVDGVHILGAYINEYDKAYMFSLGDKIYCRQPRLPDMTRCMVGGRGCQDFINIKKKGVTTALSSNQESPQARRGLVQSIVDISYLLFEEIMTGDNLWNNYGAFYDLACRYEDGFKKMSDVLFMSVYYNASKDELHPVCRYYKYDVVRSTSLIRIITPQGTPDKMDLRGYAIGSIFSKQVVADKELHIKIDQCEMALGNAEIGYPDMRASTIVVLVRVFDDKGHDTMSHLVRLDPREQSRIIVGPNQFGITEEMIEDIYQHAKKVAASFT